MAKRLHISTGAIGMYEQGRRTPSADILVGISKELGVSVDYLLMGKDYSVKRARKLNAFEMNDVFEIILEMYRNR